MDATCKAVFVLSTRTIYPVGQALHDRIVHFYYVRPRLVDITWILYVLMSALRVN